MQTSEIGREELHELRADLCVRQKRGVYYILSSLFLWCAILGIQFSSLTLAWRNMLSLGCSVLFLPMAAFFAHEMKTEYLCSDNPLSSLRRILVVNQAVCIVIAIWAMWAMPGKFVMIYAMIVSAYRLPFGWLYCSRSYYVFSVLLPVGELLLGLRKGPAFSALLMVLAECFLCMSVVLENKKLQESRSTDFCRS